MRAKTVTVTTDAAGAASVEVGMPTCALNAIRISGTTMTGGTIDIANAGRDVLDGVNPSANAMRQVREGAVVPAGTAITNSFVKPVISGPCTITVAGAGNAKTCVVTFFYE